MSRGAARAVLVWAGLAAATGCGHRPPDAPLANRSGAAVTGAAYTPVADAASAAAAVGAKVEIEGDARDAKLSAVVVAGDVTVYVLDRPRWPADLAGKRVVARGVLTFTHEHDAQIAPDGAISQGTSGGVYAFETADVQPAAAR